MRIYTRGGDSGETSLFDGARVRKADPRVAAYGDVDELNACLGAARAQLPPSCADVDALLAEVQGDLFAIGAVLADPRRDEGREQGTWTARVDLDASRAAALEPRIDAWEAELEPLTRFILPAGSPAAAALHVARAVARRAERSVVSLVDSGAGSMVVVTYLNRLSDLLFVAARLANRRANLPDVFWER
jgi:cob(I)alamin adenosyltransferase